MSNQQKNPWVTHVAEFRKSNPELTYKEALIRAKSTYTPAKRTRKQRGKGQEEPPVEIEIPQEEDPVLYEKTRQKRDAYSDEIVDKKESDFKLTGGFDLLPSYAKRFIKYNEDVKIKAYTVCRVPVAKVYKEIMSLLSNGKVQENMDKYGYDDIFHLYLVIELTDGYKYVIERNERVSIEAFTDGKDECLPWKNCSVTVGELFTKAEKKAGGWSSLIRYHPVTNNCQSFVNLMLTANNLMTPKIKKFVMQDTTNVFKDIPKVKDLIVKGFLTFAFLKGIFFN